MSCPLNTRLAQRQNEQTPNYGYLRFSPTHLFQISPIEAAFLQESKKNYWRIDNLILFFNAHLSIANWNKDIWGHGYAPMCETYEIDHQTNE